MVTNILQRNEMNKTLPFFLILVHKTKENKKHRKKQTLKKKKILYACDAAEPWRHNFDNLLPVPSATMH